MDLANTAESDRSSPKMRAAANAKEGMGRRAATPVKTADRGSWAPPRLQVPAASLRARPSEHVRQFGRLGARSSAMLDVFDVLQRFAQTDVTVTFFGETGVGKDVIAHVLHEQSARASGPFVIFDCGAVAANLAESELLGHERGAFTGAVSAHAGAFERAHGGTLFLDEVGELPVDLQPRLLRALESRKVRRVGGKTERRVDVRVIAASNRDLRADVSTGKFREDLFFRLAVAVISVPPLRERLDDLPELVQALLKDLGRADLRVADATHAALRAHPWPGNVRELKNVLACAVPFVDPGATSLDPNHLKLLQPANDKESWLEGLPLGGQALDRIERVAIRQTMAQADGNKMHAARALGIAVSTLYEKLKRYGL